jgi:mono/diheme cytochrome c family protein
MNRSAKNPVLLAMTVAAALVIAGCGTEQISVPRSAGAVYHGAVIFSQRCAGCHTLSYAGTHGSAPNVRTAQANSGPNFDQRCERPIDRVLYAIENGGFSGAYMPQNVVVGQDAIDVAKFVATYAGRAAPRQVGVAPCIDKAIGSLPPGSGTTQASVVNGTRRPAARAASAIASVRARASKRSTRA